MVVLEALIHCSYCVLEGGSWNLWKLVMHDRQIFMLPWSLLSLCRWATVTKCFIRCLNFLLNLFSWHPVSKSWDLLIVSFVPDLLLQVAVSIKNSYILCVYNLGLLSKLFVALLTVDLPWDVARWDACRAHISFLGSLVQINVLQVVIHLFDLCKRVLVPTKRIVWINL